MTYRISPTDVLQLLAPALGVRFPRETGLDERVAQALLSYQPRRESFDRLLARLKDNIFAGVYQHLGSAMLLQLEDGRVRRIMLADIDHLADLCSGLALMAQPPGAVTLEMLRELAMCNGSLGAMYALVRRYGDSLPAMERDTLARILRENGVSAL
ncbi:MAG: hypothetical protein IJE07_09670 [Clostridia bacterium]|nr:hypothetical protein [Clostridia bacterium]